MYDGWGLTGVGSLLFYQENIRNYETERVKSTTSGERRSCRFKNASSYYDGRIATWRIDIVIENAGDNATLNRTVEKYKEEGYEYDSQNSTDRLLVFAKHEEIKEYEAKAIMAAFF